MTNPVTPSAGAQLLDPPTAEPPRSVAEAFGDHYRRALAGDPTRLRGEAVGAVGRARGQDPTPGPRDNVLKRRTDDSVDRSDGNRSGRSVERDASPERVGPTRRRKVAKADRGGSSGRPAARTDEQKVNPAGTEAAAVATPRGEDAPVTAGGDATGAQTVAPAVRSVAPAAGEAPTGETVDAAEGGSIPSDGVDEAASAAEMVPGAAVAEAPETEPTIVADGDLPVVGAPVAAESSGPELDPVAAPVETVVGESAVATATGGVAVGAPGSSKEERTGKGRSVGSSGKSSAPAPGNPGSGLTGATLSESASPSAPTTTPTDPSPVTAAGSALAATGATANDTAAPVSTGPASTGSMSTGSTSGSVPTIGGGEGGAASANPTGPGPAGTTAAGRPLGPEAGSLQRVVESIEAMSRQHPPRSVTLDFGAMHGLRVRLAVHATGVQVTVTDAGAGANRVEMWERQLSDLLGERGLGSGDRDQTPGGGDREPSRPWTRPGAAPGSRVRRVRAPRTDEMRL